MTDEKKFGVNVWWSVPSVVLDGGAVQNSLIKHGFEHGDIPLPSRRKEVGRGCYSFQNRRNKEDRRITEKTQDNGKYVVYGILDEQRVNGETVRFEQGITVRLDKETGKVQVDLASVDELIQNATKEVKRAKADGKSENQIGKLEVKYKSLIDRRESLSAMIPDVYKAIQRYEGSITDEDIRAFLRKIIRLCCGMPKRRNGGIYFVPARFTDILKQAQAVLDDLGGDARLYVEGIIDGVQERENIWESVENNIDTEIQQALMAADRIGRNAKAVGNQKSKLEQLNEMVEVYKGLLGREAHYESLTERIEKAVRQVSTKISDIQSEVQVTPASKPKVKSTGKRKTRKGAKGPRGSKVYEAVVSVLNGEPMHYRAITKAIIDNGSYSGNGKYAADSVRKIIQLAVNGGDGRVVVIRPGVYKAA